MLLATQVKQIDLQAMNGILGLGFVGISHVQNTFLRNLNRTDSDSDSGTGNLKPQFTVCGLGLARIWGFGNLEALNNNYAEGGWGSGRFPWRKLFHGPRSPLFLGLAKDETESAHFSFGVSCWAKSRMAPGQKRVCLRAPELNDLEKWILELLWSGSPFMTSWLQ